MHRAASHRQYAAWSLRTDSAKAGARAHDVGRRGIGQHPGGQDHRERERSVQAEQERVRTRRQQEPRRNHQRTIRHERCRYFPRRPYDPAILAHDGPAQRRHGIH
jgi:hypothetical protein